MKPYIGSDEVQDKLSAFSHAVSLNDIENVRKYLFWKYIYPRGGGNGLDMGVCHYVIV